ncbi:MAG: dihydrofolate reductase [Gammaproteobacteria bacterium]|nr:dihydrofolate reductase [Gammaproteobacteria bacterium]
MKNTNPYLSAIVAMGENRVIGNHNQLPWHLPSDLKHFKNLTAGHIVLMGRKTFAAIGKPLPNRTNIVLSRDPDFSAGDCEVFSSIPQALDYAGRFNKEIFMIGGAELYEQTLPLTHRLYLTLVHHAPTGDAYFPPLNMQEWQVLNREDCKADEKNAYPYSFLTLEKKGIS